MAGGGSGGHLLTGVAFAQVLKRAGWQVLFLCTKRDFDKKILQEYRLPHIPTSAISFKPANPVRLISQGAVAFIDSFYAIFSYKPDIVVGLGGYGAFTPVLVAQLLGIPTVIFEQNVYPGLSNRFLQFFARRIYCQWAEARRYFVNVDGKFLQTGMPLREFTIYPKHQARLSLGLDPRKFTVLIMGGSQGAEWINRTILDEIQILGDIKDKIQFIHITGGKFDEDLRVGYLKNGIQFYLTDFTDAMGMLYSASDFAISRAGALTIAELERFNLSALLIPYPFSRDNHQLYNALAMVKRGQACMISQRRYKKGQITCILKARLLNKGIYKRGMREGFTPNPSSVIMQDLRNLLCKR